MSKSHSNKPSTKRLTFTYGMEDGATRTVTVPVARANAILVVVIATLVWSGVSALYLSTRGLATGAPAIVAPASVAAVTAPSQPKVETPVVAQPVADRIEAPRVATTEPATPEETEAVVDAQAQAAEQDESVPVPVVAALPASFDDMTFASAGDRLSVKFGLVNLGDGALEGEVGGTATFVADDGREIQVEAEEARSFSARIRTSKSLRFAPPPGVAGRFTNVRLVAKDATRELAKSYETPAPR